jgi:hypothetical protein
MKSTLTMETEVRNAFVPLNPKGFGFGCRRWQNCYDKISRSVIIALLYAVRTGKHEIVEILERLSIRPRDDIATQAHRFYTVCFLESFYSHCKRRLGEVSSLITSFNITNASVSVYLHVAIGLFTPVANCPLQPGSAARH